MQRSKKKTAEKPSKKQPAKKTVKAKSNDKSKGNSLFKFRRYKKIEGGKKKKARHPKLIVDETDTEYGFMGLTEEEKSGHHTNIMLTKNPKKGDTRKSYVRKELRYDNQNNFGKILEAYELSEEDKRAILEYIKKRKKKK